MLLNRTGTIYLVYNKLGLILGEAITVGNFVRLI